MDIHFHRQLYLPLMLILERTEFEIAQLEIAAQLQGGVAVAVFERPLPGPVDGLFQGIHFQYRVAGQLVRGGGERAAVDGGFTVAKDDATTFAGGPDAIAEQEDACLDHTFVVVVHRTINLVGWQSAFFGVFIRFAHQHELHFVALLWWIVTRESCGRGSDRHQRRFFDEIFIVDWRVARYGREKRA